MTSAATFDAVVTTLKTWRHLPAINFLNDYSAHKRITFPHFKAIYFDTTHVMISIK
jgi:hypothetical protein